MQSWPKKRIFVRLLAFAILAVSFTMLGCSEDGDDDDNLERAERTDLESRTFTFTNGQAFGVPNQQVTLALGTFVARNDTDEAPFTLTAAGGRATGTFFVDESGTNFGIDPDSTCDLSVVASTIPGISPGQFLRFEPCDVNDANGALRMVNEATDAVASSEIPVINR